MQSSMLRVSALIALATYIQGAVAAPPACLLACVSQVEKKSDCTGLNDLSCICSKNSKAVEDCLKKICPNDTSDDAISAFESSCDGYSKDVSSSSESSSATSSAASSSEAASSSAASSAASSAVSSAVSSAAASSEAASSAAASSAAASSTFSSVVESVVTSSEAPESVAGVSTVASSSASSAVAVSQHSAGAADATGFSVGAMLSGLVGVALL